jgi:hypothetical protein
MSVLGRHNIMIVQTESLHLTSRDVKESHKVTRAKVSEKINKVYR